ncbi:MAG: ribosomal large subunit pseudouridine synthase rRNA synthase [Candidatus Parcubacteria bacterium]|jgi:23S rRNA pseudouridine1911/1915/1917 synthase
MSNKTQKIPKIEILYEDDDCLVINKPQALMVHPDGRGSGLFLTDWIIKKYPETAKVGEHARTPEGETLLRPGIVHRLDRETSGALIIAKTKKGHAHLKDQFKDRTMVKKYLAFVWGEMSDEFGTITRPIGRSGSDFRKWSAQRGARGEMRDAETYWSKIATKQLTQEGKKEKFSLIEVEPKTGRTHQIRVHMMAVNHPVVGDILYAPRRPFALGFKRTALHARSIEFTNLAGKRIKVESPLPKDFENGCKKLGVSLTKRVQI